jgi:hypothetical protein
MRTLIIALLASVTLLTGCTPRTGRSAVARISPATLSSTDSGVVVLSLAAANKRRAHFTSLWVYDWQAERSARPRPELIMDLVGVRSDFERPPGSVNAFPLAPGKYSLRPERLLALGKRVPSFDFEVRAGETTYLGELFMVYVNSQEARFFIRDQYERDMAVARAKNPAFESRPVVKRLLQPGTPVITPSRR